MMTRLWIACFCLLLGLNQTALAQQSDLFTVNASGIPAVLNIQLCLYGPGPTSCEAHAVNAQTLAITTNIPNRTYPAAGIKVLTPGYSLTGCTFNKNGFCIFTANNATPVNIQVISVAVPVSLTSLSVTSGPAIGGTGVDLIGTNLVGATSVTFGGVPATGINVINSTTVNVVTPAHAVGVVSVTITTANGTATLPNSFTYLTTAIGQFTGGGKVGCLNGGDQDLVSALVDNSGTVPSLPWGGFGSLLGATSFTDGQDNTQIIVTALGPGTYAAKLCDDYQIDSRGNSPCQPGNVCYDDWFLPALSQIGCLFLNRTTLGGFSPLPYWSSTENSTNDAWDLDFSNGGASTVPKLLINQLIRCVRPLT